MIAIAEVKGVMPEADPHRHKEAAHGEDEEGKPYGAGTGDLAPEGAE